MVQRRQQWRYLALAAACNVGLHPAPGTPRPVGRLSACLRLSMTSPSRLRHPTGTGRATPLAAALAHGLASESSLHLLLSKSAVGGINTNEPLAAFAATVTLPSGATSGHHRDCIRLLSVFCDSASSASASPAVSGSHSPASLKDSSPGGLGLPCWQWQWRLESQRSGREWARDTLDQC